MIEGQSFHPLRSIHQIDLSRYRSTHLCMIHAISYSDEIPPQRGSWMDGPICNSSIFVPIYRSFMSKLKLPALSQIYRNNRPFDKMNLAIWVSPEMNSVNVFAVLPMDGAEPNGLFVPQFLVTNTSMGRPNSDLGAVSEQSSHLRGAMPSPQVLEDSRQLNR